MFNYLLLNPLRNIIQFFSLFSISSLICFKKSTQNTLSNNILCDSTDSLNNKTITIQIKKLNIPKLSRKTSYSNLLDSSKCTQNTILNDFDEEKGNLLDNNLFIEEKHYVMRKFRLSEVDFERKFSLFCDSCKNKIPINSEAFCYCDKIFCTESCKQSMFSSHK